MIQRIHTVILGSVPIVCLFCVSLASADTNDIARAQVANGDTAAFLRAGTEGRKDLVPLLEQFANASADPFDGQRVSARMALAKLGVKKYFDEFATDLTSTNSPVFKFWKENNQGLGMPTLRAEREAELVTKQRALERLVYIGDKSTVKYVAAELYNTNKPDRPPSSTNFLESRTPVAWLAAGALSQMNLQDAPQPGSEPDPEGLNRIEAWKKWWEKNKDKYP